MANLKASDADGSVVYIKSSGAGSDVDPFITEQAITLLAGANTIGNVGVASLPGSVETNIGLLAGAVSGTELQVDVLTLPSLTASVDNFPASQTVDGTVGVGAITQPTAIIQEVKTVTTAGTRENFASASVGGVVIVTALAGNTGTLYVGNASVSSSAYGWALAAGESTGPIAIDNTDKIYLDVATSGDGASVGGS